MLTQRPTPAFMSQEAARRLPRFALPLLLAAFILTSFWAEGLWTLRDAAGFGTAQSMLHGGLEAWLLPQIDGHWETDAGPLAGWVAALCLKLFSSLLGDIRAYRAASVFWFLLTATAVWLTVWRLSRRAEALPVAFAFGGQAEAPSYARTTSSCAVLLFVAAFGIATRQYEPIPETALVSIAALALFGVTWSLKRPFAGALLTGAASGAAMLTSSLSCGFWLLGAALAAHAVLHTLPGSRDRRMVTLLAGYVLPPLIWLGSAFLLCPDAASEWTQLWLRTQSGQLELVSAEAVLWLSRTFVWYLIPMWPLALWAVYSWRRQLDRTQILLPLLFCGAAVLAGLFTSRSGAEGLLLILIAPASVLATFGLVTLRRSRENLLDWFALSAFSVALLALWLYWLAALTGSIAPKMARSIDMLAPGLEVSVSLSLIPPVIVTILWIVFVVWRLTHQPVVIWRGPWLSAAGMTAIAVTLLGLWHEGIDVNRSYAGVAAETAAAAERLAGRDARISGDALPGGIRAALSFHSGIVFAQPGEAAPLRLVRVRGDEIPAGALTAAISRPHTDESFFLVPGSVR